MRGKVDLIYTDPPFDSEADYRTRIELPGGGIDSNPTVLEQFAYADPGSGTVGGGINDAPALAQAAPAMYIAYAKTDPSTVYALLQVLSIPKSTDSGQTWSKVR